MVVPTFTAPTSTISGVSGIASDLFSSLFPVVAWIFGIMIAFWIIEYLIGKFIDSRDPYLQKDIEDLVGETDYTGKLTRRERRIFKHYLGYKRRFKETMAGKGVSIHTK
jgi:hypothetical protein